MNTLPALRLLRSRLITGPARIRALARGLDALPPFPSGAYSCPADDGAAIVAKIAYPRRHTVTINIALTGCRTATNGSLRRTALGVGSTHEAPVLALLERLLPG